MVFYTDIPAEALRYSANAKRGTEQLLDLAIALSAESNDI